MNRRAFFSILAGAAAVARDPERLLWTPGKKLISIPKPPVVTVHSINFSDVFAVGDIITFGKEPQRYIVKAISTSRADLLPYPGWLTARP